MTSAFEERKRPSQRAECYSRGIGGSFLRRVISIRRRGRRCARDSLGVRPAASATSRGEETAKGIAKSLAGVRSSSIAERLPRFARTTPARGSSEVYLCGEKDEGGKPASR